MRTHRATTQGRPVSSDIVSHIYQYDDPRRRATDSPFDQDDERQRLAIELEILKGIDPDKTRLYIHGVISTSVIAMLTVIGITIVRPTQDNTALIATVLGVLGPVIAGLMAAVGQEVLKTWNGKMTEAMADRLQAHRTAARLQGRLDPRTPRPGQRPQNEPE